MNEYTVGLQRTQIVAAVVTVKASSPEEAMARAEDWMNNGRDWSDSDEFVTDVDDDPYGGHGLDDAEWSADSDVKLDGSDCEKCSEFVPVSEYCGNDKPNGETEYLCSDCYVPKEE